MSLKFLIVLLIMGYVATSVYSFLHVRGLKDALYTAQAANVICVDNIKRQNDLINKNKLEMESNRKKAEDKSKRLERELLKIKEEYRSAEGNVSCEDSLMVIKRNQAIFFSDRY